MYVNLHVNEVYPMYAHSKGDHIINYLNHLVFVLLQLDTLFIRRSNHVFRYFLLFYMGHLVLSDGIDFIVRMPRARLEI